MIKSGTWVPTIAAESIAEGQMIGVEIGDVRIALYRVNGRFHATANVCTHAFAILSDGWLDGDIVECPLHGGRFNVCTGKAGGDPVETDLQVYPTRIETGIVEVLLET